MPVSGSVYSQKYWNERRERSSRNESSAWDKVAARAAIAESAQPAAPAKNVRRRMVSFHVTAIQLAPVWQAKAPAPHATLRYNLRLGITADQEREFYDGM